MYGNNSPFFVTADLASHIINISNIKISSKRKVPALAAVEKNGNSSENNAEISKSPRPKLTFIRANTETARTKTITIVEMGLDVWVSMYEKPNATATKSTSNRSILGDISYGFLEP